MLPASTAPEGSKGLSVVAKDQPVVRRLGRKLPASVTNHLDVTCGLLGIVLLVVAWQVTSTLHVVNPLFVSRPSNIAVALAQYVSSPQFGGDITHSGISFLLGLGISVVLGVGIGLAMGWYSWVRYTLDYLISLAYAAPRIALVPIIVLWFGTGIESEVVIIVLIAIFPVIINTMAGVRSVDSDYVELAASFNARPRQIFSKVLLPAAIPSILSGIRNAIGAALIGMVVAEFLASTSGVGYAISQAADTFAPGRVFAGVIIIMVTGLFLTELVKRVEIHFNSWRL